MTCTRSRSRILNHPRTVKSFLFNTPRSVCDSVYSITSQISSPPSHFRRQRSQPLRWICWNFRTATECAFAIERDQWIRVFPWLYWCRSVWYKNVLTTVGCDASWAKVGTIRFHWANYMVNPWGIQEKIYHSNSRGTRQFHGLAPWLEFH